MTPEKRILNVLRKISDISNNRHLTFEVKIRRLLNEIVDCMQVKKASIMLMKNRKTLQVVASTNSKIIGITQKLDADTPSTWVVKNKKPLYMDGSQACECPTHRFSHYKGEAFFLVPIIDHGKVIGVVNATEKIGEDAFGENEREILLQIVSQVISALENNRLAESLKQKQQDLKKKNAALERLERLRTEFFNMLIHDLKGPISEIVANLDILSYTLEGENLELVETAQSGCDTLFNMVSNLLDIARLEEGKLKLVVEEINAPELLKEALARLLVSVRSKNIVFEESIPSDAQLMLHADRTLLLRVLQNLITNAIQFSPANAHIVVGVACADDMIELFVQDQGPGIPPEFSDTIFDKFSQLDKRYDGRVYTTGLGLAFCKMAVEAHGGTIWVESDGRTGSRFVCKVPREQGKVQPHHG